MVDLDVDDRVPTALIRDVLIALAKHCPRANGYMEMYMDYRN